MKVILSLQQWRMMSSICNQRGEGKMKAIRFIMAAAAIAASLTSCNKKEIEAPSAGDTVKVRIHAGAVQTKTVFGEKEDSQYPVLWTTNKKVSIYVADNYPVKVLPDAAGASTTFTAELSSATEGMLRVFSPAGVYNSSDATKNEGGFTQTAIKSTDTYAYCIVPDKQTPLDGSCDEAAQLVAGSMDIPSTGVPEDIDLDFNLVNAFGKLVLKNVSSDALSQVTLTFPKSVAGTSIHYNYASGELSNANVKVLTLNASEISKDAEGNFVLFFGVVPVELTTGKFEVNVVDSKGSVYTKTASLSENKPLNFEAGHVKPINVTFDSVAEGGDDEWTLVTDASVLVAGDKLVLANYDKGVTAGQIGTDFMASVSSQFSPDHSTITGLGDGTVVLTLGGSKDAWTLTSESGVLGATAAKKLAWDKGTMTWSISCDTNGGATVQNATEAYGRILYNVNSPRFTTYTSATNVSMLLPNIYRKSAGGAGTDQPVESETVVETEGASSVTSTSATLNGSYEKAAQLPYEAGFEWGTAEDNLRNVEQYRQALPGVQGTFHVTLRNLDPGKTYYYRAYITVLENGNYEYYYGETYSFDAAAEVTVSSPGVPKWFELPAQADADENGIDDNNPDLYYSWTMRADAPKIRNFSAGYSKSKIHPVWVAAPMHTCYKGGASRSNAYKNDPAIACEQSAKFDGYTRGHMIGSSDRTVSAATNRQVFYYSNIGAQISSGFNTGGGAWNNLEDLIDGQFCSDTLYQVVGAIFEDFTAKDGTKVSAKTALNDADKAFQVPTAWYAVVLRTKAGNTGKRVDQCTADELKCAAFILPHKSNAGHKPNAKDLYSVEDLEKLTGLNYFVNVPNAPKSTVKASDWGL